ncbi:iron ABC transporter permease [Ureaplasma parvum]|uniref:iron ABC transporter permease n=1 Tax=Ureaplasma parvum TaxID=134821 RepID=UPI002430F09A|nr:iron ABC transporter permease [Ureaplasma parvum]
MNKIKNAKSSFLYFKKMHNLKSFNKKRNRLKGIQIIFIVFLIIFCSLFFLIDLFFTGNHLNIIKRMFENSSLSNSTYIFVPVANIITGFSLGIGSISIQITSKNILAGPSTLGFTPMAILASTISFIITSSGIFSTILIYCLGLIFSFIIIGVNFILVRNNFLENSFKPILVAFGIGALVTGINIVLIATHDNLKIVGWWRFITINNTLINNYRMIVSSVLMIISTIILLFLSPYLNIIRKDYILAKSLGIKVNLIYWLVAICVVTITISSSILLGIIALLGVIVGIIIQTIFKKTHVLLLMILAGLFGSGILSFSSYINEYIPSAREMIICVFAIPVFAYILSKRKGFIK